MFSASKFARTLFLGVALGSASAITTAARAEHTCLDYTDCGSGGAACTESAFECYCEYGAGVPVPCMPIPFSREQG
jgi:hypothetical protein